MNAFFLYSLLLLKDSRSFHLNSFDRAPIIPFTLSITLIIYSLYINNTICNNTENDTWHSEQKILRAWSNLACIRWKTNYTFIMHEKTQERNEKEMKNKEPTNIIIQRKHQRMYALIWMKMCIYTLSHVLTLY